MKFKTTVKSFINRLPLFLLKIMGTWLSDGTYLKLKFYLTTGYPLNLKNPKTFQEKIQWLKLNDRNPYYTDLVDKYAVKKIVADSIGKEYVIPNLGVWNNFEEIDFKSLPEKFVLKTTHGGGSLGVVICNDKQSFDYTAAKKKLQKSLNQSIYKYMREWPYKNVPRRIIAETFIDIPLKNDLTDYKIFCFNGKPQYIQVIQDRNSEETIDFFDTNWKHQPFVGLTNNCRNAKTIPEMPKNLRKMLEIAEQLAKNTKFVRVDLYNIEGKIYFGELTFYPASGFGKITPSTWDRTLGDLLTL